ncbi:MAG: ATP-binding protein [Oscillatoriaceae bacterium SKW80]|nr:ATP-binding protein [Oscillatoriaceae bacterium SKYG93]MCX8121788.1 ATP-binding protein [Oscillatoriaceae bacterium SKW80]MDW8452557.1 ATP-binding protein [Oscillatoriaceae cyanobacterium SKYGB_i_bin93]HIK28660.1 GAF domain-containing protein [Oscillatoriaceae cyanobacterium M7585_C2015_266]
MAESFSKNEKNLCFHNQEQPGAQEPFCGHFKETKSSDSEYNENPPEVIPSENKTGVSSLAKPLRNRFQTKCKTAKPKKQDQKQPSLASQQELGNLANFWSVAETNEAVMAKKFKSLPSCQPQAVSIPAPQVQLMQQTAFSADLEQKIAQLIQKKGDPETLLKEVAMTLGQALQVDGCLIAVRDSLIKDSINQDFQGKIYAYPNHTQAVFEQETICQQELSAIENQIDACEIIAIADLESLEGQKFKTQLWEILQVKAILAIKTQFQGQVNGEIVVMRSQPNCWKDSEQELLKTVSNQVAIAISQVVQTRLLKYLQKQVGGLAQHRHLIKKLTMAIHNSSELNEIFKLATEGMVETLQVSVGSILLLKYVDPLLATRPATVGSKRTLPNAKVIIVSTLSNSENSFGQNQYPEKNLVNQVFWLSECALCSSAFTQAPNPLAIAQRRSLPTLEAQKGLASFFPPETMPAMLLVPLMGATGGSPVSSTVLGFLLLQNSTPRSWQPDELELLEVVAAQISTAIIQNQKIQRVQALVEERTAQLQRSLDVQAKLYEKTRQQVEQLRRLNQLKDEFLSTMSHELRTPLTSMTLAIRMLRQPGLSDERRSKYLDILEQQCLQETNLINDLLTLQQLESQTSGIQLQKIDLKNLIYDLQQSTAHHWRNKGLKLAVDLPAHPLKLETDFDSLNRILQELLINAGKYSDPGTTVFLRARYQTEENIPQIVISVTNTGAGISPEELPHIFDKFRRGAGVTQQAIAGTGLGLALVKCLVQHLNGTITVTSHPLGYTPAWETCFTLTLPQQFYHNKLI